MFVKTHNYTLKTVCVYTKNNSNFYCSGKLYSPELPSTTLVSLERTERSGKEGHGPQQDFPGTKFDIKKHPLGLHLPSFTQLVRV